MAIEGRSSLDRLCGAGWRSFSLGAASTHEDVFRRACILPFVQERPGEALVRVEPANGFTAEGGARLTEEHGKRSDGSIRSAVEVVDARPLTALGKFKFVEQRFQPGQDHAQ